MLPPKLAQIIINLATGPVEFTAIQPQLSGDVYLNHEDDQKMRVQRSSTQILDPFCGTGVVLQEATLMGYRVLGSDLDPRMVEYTKQNLLWLAEHYKRNVTAAEIGIGDATHHHWKQAIDIVASETYLGRPFTTPPAPEVLAQTITDCNLIIEKFLKNIHAQLRADTRLCIAIPAWQSKQQRFRHLPLIDHLRDMGYNRISFKHVQDEDLLYYRDDQIVARELLVLTKI
jgi:SAM-dependent methyltransferase